jgi:hypothetical protein
MTRQLSPRRMLAPIPVTGTRFTLEDDGERTRAERHMSVGTLASPRDTMGVIVRATANRDEMLGGYSKRCSQRPALGVKCQAVFSCNVRT